MHVTSVYWIFSLFVLSGTRVIRNSFPLCSQHCDSGWKRSQGPKCASVGGALDIADPNTYENQSWYFKLYAYKKDQSSPLIKGILSLDVMAAGRVVILLRLSPVRSCVNAKEFPDSIDYAFAAEMNSKIRLIWKNIEFSPFHLLALCLLAGLYWQVRS